jgi:hypothetical protein
LPDLEAKLKDGVITAPRTLGFGGCMLNNPLNVAGKAKLVDNRTFRKIGFKRTPAAFTPGAIKQFISFCDRKLDIPTDVQPYCFVEAGTSEPVQLVEAAGDLLRAADVALVELVTPVETVYRDWRLNYNYITLEMQKRAEEIGPEAGLLIRDWRSKGLTRSNEEARVHYRDQILDIWPVESSSDVAMRDIIAEARGEQRSVDQMFADLREIQSLLNIPVVMVQHVYRYMPDGRTISWPTSFMEDVVLIAERLGVPIFHPSEVVVRHGVRTAMAEDYRHYQPDFYPTIGHALAEFASKAARVA